MAPAKDSEVESSAEPQMVDLTPNPEPDASNPSREAAPVEAATTNGQLPKDKKPVQAEKNDDNAAGGEQKPSGAELKRRQKAEKAARRQQAKDAKEQTGADAKPGPNRQDSQTVAKKTAGGKDGPPLKGEASSSQGPGGKVGKPHKRTLSASLNLPKQRTKEKDRDKEAESTDDLKPEEKKVPLFGHLYGLPRRDRIRGAEKDVHPAVLALGLQMAEWVIVGAIARTVAMLLAFKQVIQSYTTPPGVALSRHLTTHLNHQIEYIRSCRPLGIAMGNSIRWLKTEVSKVDPSTPEDTAKKDLCYQIDLFIRERITAADELISKEASKKICDGDVILTANKSSIVEKTLLHAKSQGKNFRVYIIDSRPLLEGRKMASALVAADIPVSYSFQHALAHATHEATKCLLGAHAMMSNGRLFSRAGTAMVAMMAHTDSIPVIVCCESIKFSDRVALDSIVHNEIASPDELVGHDTSDSLTKLLAGMSVPAIAAGEPLPPNPSTPHSSSPSNTNKSKQNPKDKVKPRSENIAAATYFQDDEADDSSDDDVLTLETWRGGPEDGLTMLNLMYDLAPAEYVDLVVCEYGNLPPSSVPVVHRMAQGQN